MIRFAPQWVTSGTTPLDNSPVVEGDAFDSTLVAVDSASTLVTPASQIVVNFQKSPGTILTVTLGGQTVDPTNVSQTGPRVTISTVGMTLGSNPVQAVFVRAAAPTYSLLSGDLPPGMTLNTTTGKISGTLGNVPEGSASYVFSVRASNGDRVRDRTFTIRTVPQQNFQTIVLNTLPSSRTDNTGNFDYYPFAVLARADGFLKTVDVTHPIGGEVLAFYPSNVSNVVTFIEGPPPGIYIDGLSIRGTVSASAAAGRYLFGLDLATNSAGNPIIVEMVIENILSTTVERPVVISWLTPSGNIGTIKEGYPSSFQVGAEITDTGNLSYLLAPMSSSLPKGMRINAQTGAVEGVAPHVAKDTEVRFTVRALRDGNYVDRDFSFTILNLYMTSDVLDVRMKLRNTDRVPMVRRLTQLITTDKIFRPTDPAFGMPEEPYIYFIKGVNAAPFDASLNGTDNNAITTNTDYHGPIALVLGQHNYAVVRDPAGNVLYEVVYRVVYDPQAKAGGFSFTSDEVTEQRVIHAQSGKDIFPLSIRNARLDIVRDCGFPTQDSILRYQVGLGSSESLPAWMTSQQTKGDDDSILGFIPAIVIAFVNPGQASALVATLNADSTLVPLGRQVVLDRYYLYTISYGSATTFDSDTTTFDNHMVFDFGIVGSETPVQV